MTKFVVEEELEKVKDKETQKLLEEVISCYSNGNYRATIVTLYTRAIRTEYYNSGIQVKKAVSSVSLRYRA